LLLTSITWASPGMDFQPLVISRPSQQVTKLGKNRQPLFISNTGVLYVSQKRPQHQGPQLYFLDLATGKEKRISHQKGEVSIGMAHGGHGRFFYSSSTDEDKETPFILKKYLDRFPSSVESEFFFHVDFRPQEIYSSDVDGTNIQRLTNYSGYDGFPYYHQDKDRLYFSRWQEGKMDLFAKSLRKNLAPWKVMKTAGHDMGLQLSPDKTQFVWFRFSPDFKTSQLLLSGTHFKNPHFLTLDAGIHWNPIWHPNGKTVIYSAKIAPTNHFDLYEVSTQGECTRQLTSYDGDEFYPALSPDGKTLLFTSTQTGNEQIHKMGYPGPIDCKATDSP
ncbi:MAG: hypothetical protein AAF203_01900, partial [Pseudomonadota bacterium]